MKHSPFTVTLLGTGTSSGVPMIGCECNVCKSNDPKDKRLRSSILIQSASVSVVIDTSPDFRQQMLLYDVRKLDAIIYTHPHKDHIAGLDDVRAFNFFSQKPMSLFLNDITEKRLKNEFDYAFASQKFDGVPHLELHTIHNQPFQIGDLEFIPISVWHHKMPVLGFRINNFTYITDANKIEKHEMDKMKGTETLVINALRKNEHLSHFTLNEAISICNDLKVNKGYFTHISHQLGLHQEINKELPNHLQLAFDGLQLYF